MLKPHPSELIITQLETRLNIRSCQVHAILMKRIEIKAQQLRSVKLTVPESIDKCAYCLTPVQI